MIRISAGSHCANRLDRVLQPRLTILGLLASALEDASIFRVLARLLGC
jgi:hypothetical protein